MVVWTLEDYVVTRLSMLLAPTGHSLKHRRGGSMPLFREMATTRIDESAVEMARRLRNRKLPPCVLERHQVFLARTRLDNKKTHGKNVLFSIVIRRVPRDTNTDRTFFSPHPYIKELRYVARRLTSNLWILCEQKKNIRDTAPQPGKP